MGIKISTQEIGDVVLMAFLKPNEFSFIALVNEKKFHYVGVPPDYELKIEDGSDTSDALSEEEQRDFAQALAYAMHALEYTSLLKGKRK